MCENSGDVVGEKTDWYTKTIIFVSNLPNSDLNIDKQSKPTHEMKLGKIPAEIVYVLIAFYIYLYIYKWCLS